MIEPMHSRRQLEKVTGLKGPALTAYLRVEIMAGRILPVMAPIDPAHAPNQQRHYCRVAVQLTI